MTFFVRSLIAFVFFSGQVSPLLARGKSSLGSSPDIPEYVVVADPKLEATLEVVDGLTRAKSELLQDLRRKIDSQKYAGPNGDNEYIGDIVNQYEENIVRIRQIPAWRVNRAVAKAYANAKDLQTKKELAKFFGYTEFETQNKVIGAYEDALRKHLEIAYEALKQYRSAQKVLEMQVVRLEQSANIDQNFRLTSDMNSRDNAELLNMLEASAGYSAIFGAAGAGIAGLAVLVAGGSAATLGIAFGATFVAVFIAVFIINLKNSKIFDSEIEDVITKMKEEGLGESLADARAEAKQLSIQWRGKLILDASSNLKNMIAEFRETYELLSGVEILVKKTTLDRKLWWDRKALLKASDDDIIEILAEVDLR